MLDTGSLLVAEAETHISNKIGGAPLLPVAKGSIALVRGVEGGWYRIHGGWVASERDGVDLWVSAEKYAEAMLVDSAFQACMRRAWNWEIPRPAFAHTAGCSLRDEQRMVAFYVVWTQTAAPAIGEPVLQRLYFFVVLHWGRHVADAWLTEHPTAFAYAARCLRGTLGNGKTDVYVERIAALMA